METLLLAVVFASATQTFQLPERLLSALCYVESNHNPNSVHIDDGNGNSLGICQIKLNTARIIGFRGTEKELMTPKVNAHYAAKYLKKQINRYHGDVLKAVAAYNSGTYRENNSGTPINKQYITKVFKAWVEKR